MFKVVFLTQGRLGVRTVLFGHVLGKTRSETRSCNRAADRVSYCALCFGGLC